MCGFFCYHGMQKEAPMELLFVACYFETVSSIKFI